MSLTDIMPWYTGITCQVHGLKQSTTQKNAMFSTGKITAAVCQNLQIREFKDILNLLFFVGITYRKKKDCDI